MSPFPLEVDFNFGGAAVEVLWEPFEAKDLLDSACLAFVDCVKGFEGAAEDFEGRGMAFGVAVVAPIDAFAPDLRVTFGFCVVPYCFQATKGSSLI
jgi:hypothetical protein